MSTQKPIHKVDPKKYIMPFWEYLSEVLIEPIILAFAAFLMFEHIKNVWDATHNLGDFWHKLNEPTGINVLIALTFFGVLVIWGWVKALHIRREYRRDKELSDKIEGAIRANGNDIVILAEGIRQLVEEMRKDREDRHGKQPTIDESEDM